MRGQEDGFLAPLCYAPLGVSASRRLPVYYLPMARDLAPLVDTLAEIVGPRHVRTALPERVTYAKDGLPTHRRVPGVVVLPGNRDEVIAIVRLLGALGMPFVPRGAGTGLSGGALADGDAVLIVLTRLNRILKIDARNRLAVVEPGVVNVRLSLAAAPHGLQYTPDPSSQTACTIGGNVAENAGGPHCLKYGVTATHVLALEVALADGRVVELGSPGGEPWGPDLVGLFVGSEGNFGVATRITVRLLPVARAVRTLLADFTSLRTAGEAVSADAQQREKLWLGRKKAFGAMGRLSRDLVVQDAVVPRSTLPDVLETISRIAAAYGLTVSNVFHAGDGNLHPNISFDGRVPGLRERVEAASAEIMATCIAAGGTITGEHGIGLDKLRYMPLLFDGDSLAAMRAVRRVWDPEERVNPGKVVPVHACREWSGLRIADFGLRSARAPDPEAQSAIRNPQSAIDRKAAA